MVLTKDLLDKRICDVEPGSNNTQTYREFIRESEEAFYLLPCDLENMKDKHLDMYLDFLSELWNK